MTRRPAAFSAATSAAEVVTASTSYTSAATDLSRVPVSCHCQVRPTAGFHQPAGAAGAGEEGPAAADEEPRPPKPDGGTAAVFGPPRCSSGSPPVPVHAAAYRTVSRTKPNRARRSRRSVTVRPPHAGARPSG